jgi:hypothetical protein
MNLADYQTQSRDTAIYPDRDRNLWYPTLGLIGEVAEYLRADETEKIKEAGDVAWYCAQICSEAGLKLDDIIGPIEPLEPLMKCIGELAELVKKLYRDRHGEVSDNDRMFIALNLNHLWHHCIPASDQALILTTNITKLQNRKSRGVLGGSGDDR